MPDEPILERYLRSWSDAYGLVKNRAILWPFVILAALKLTLLLLAAFFWMPGLSGVVAPVLGSLAGEEALHFPNHVAMLPDIYQAIDMFLVLTVGFVMYAWAVSMMVDSLNGDYFIPHKNLAGIAVFIPSILLIGFVFAIFAFVVPFYLVTVAGIFDERPKVQFLITSVAMMVNFGVHVLLVYSLFFLDRPGGTSFSAIRLSSRFARRELPLTSLIVLTAFLLRLSFLSLASRTGPLLTTGKSDMVLVLLICAILIDVAATFYLFAAATSVAMEKTHEDDLHNV